MAAAENCPFMLHDDLMTHESTIKFMLAVALSSPLKCLGDKELRAGYVAVSGDIVGADFLTVCKDVKKHSENAINQRADNPAWLAKQAD